MTILDCGHEPTETDSDFTNGIVHHADDSTLCYACATAEIRAEVANVETKRIGLYLSGGSPLKVTTWTGEEVMRVTQHTSARTGFYGSTMYYVRAVAPDGSEWYGRGGGPGMYVTMNRAKGIK